MFSQKKPFSAVTVTIERLTSEAFGVDDLSGIPDLVEVIKLQASGPSEAARAISKKFKYGNVHRQLRALVLLDGLIQNAGPHVRRGFADEPLLERLRVCGTSGLSDPAVRTKCTELFREWSQYVSTTGLERLARLYRELPKRKVGVTQERLRAIKETENPFEDEDGDQAAETVPRPSAGPSSASSASWTPNHGSLLDKARKKKDKDQSQAKGKRRTLNVESEKDRIKSVIAEASIEATSLMNSLQSINREHQRISDNKAAVRHFEACKQLRRRLIRYIHLVESEQWLGSLLHANDELVHALMSFEQLDQSIDADSDSEDELAEQAHAQRMTALRAKDEPGAQGPTGPRAAHDMASFADLSLSLAPPAPRPSIARIAAPARPPRPDATQRAPGGQGEDDDADDPFSDENVVSTPVHELGEPCW